MPPPELAALLRMMVPVMVSAPALSMAPPLLPVEPPVSVAPERVRAPVLLTLKTRLRLLALMVS